MNKKNISYIGITVGVTLIFFGSSFLCLREKALRKCAIENPKKDETIKYDVKKDETKKDEAIVSKPIVKLQSPTVKQTPDPQSIEKVLPKLSAKTQSATVTKHPLVIVQGAKDNSIKLKKSQKKRKISFRYRSSKPKTVFLIGDFNNWDKKANPMKQGKNYVWEAILSLIPGEYQYAFVVDGKRINDPNNKKTVHLKDGKASILKIEPIQ
ncbi:MAG: isoamylase early set domain-containing protein [Elusimicrobiota bacterium]